MMIGEKARLIPSIEVPPWDPLDDSRTRSPFSITSPSVIRNGNAGNGDPVLDYIRTMHRYLTSNEFAGVESDPPDTEEFDMAVDAFSCDHFRMFEFKVRKCARARSHDWTDCPYAHPAEKARRRDPRKYHYSGTACPEFRKGICKKGDACEFAHGIFECWLHPTRYRTQPCKDGLGCRRRVCFFAHSPEQLRVLSQQSPGSLGSGDSFDGSPPRQTHRHAFESYLEKMAMVSSPPLSPSSPSVPPNSAEHGCHCGSVYNFTPSCRLVALMRDLHLDKTKMNPQWNVQMDPGCGSTIRTGFNSMPSTPTRTSTLSGLGAVDHWSIGAEEEHAMERVESGKYLRDKIYAELSRDNSVGQGRDSAVSAPDVGWVSELVK